MTHDDAIVGVVTTPHRVIYADTDAMGIVYYGNYLRFFEVGRNEYFRACGASYELVERGGYHLVVIDVRARYRAPARYDDLILIETSLAVLGAARLRFHYHVRRAADSGLLVSGATEHACVKAATGRPVRLPPVILQHVRPRKDP